MPRGIEINSENNVYVADWFNNDVKKYDSNGLFYILGYHRKF